METGFSKSLASLDSSSSIQRTSYMKYLPSIQVLIYAIQVFFF